MNERKWKIRQTFIKVDYILEEIVSRKFCIYVKLNLTGSEYLHGITNHWGFLYYLIRTRAVIEDEIK